MCVGVDGTLSKKDLEITCHMYEDKSHQDESRESHEVFFAKRARKHK